MRPVLGLMCCSCLQRAHRLPTPFAVLHHLALTKFVELRLCSIPHSALIPAHSAAPNAQLQVGLQGTIVCSEFTNW